MRILVKATQIWIKRQFENLPFQKILPVFTDWRIPSVALGKFFMLLPGLYWLVQSAFLKKANKYKKWAHKRLLRKQLLQDGKTNRTRLFLGLSAKWKEFKLSRIQGSKPNAGKFIMNWPKTLGVWICKWADRK